MKPRHSILLALLMLALAFAIGGKSAEHTAMRALVWQCVRTVLRPLGIR